MEIDELDHEVADSITLKSTLEFAKLVLDIDGWHT
jgi:hypothetical protein